MNFCPFCHGTLEQADDTCPHCERHLELDTLAGTAATSFPTLRRRRLSRRQMIVGMAGLTVAGTGLVGLGITTFVQRLTSPPTSVIYTGDDNYVEYVAWSPDGKRLGSGGFAGIVHLWTSTSGQRLLDYPAHGQRALALEGLAWSPEGTRIASFSVDSPIQVWETTTGKLLTTYGEPRDPPFAFAWSPDWARLALAQIDTVQVIDSRTRVLLASYRGHTDAVGYPSPAKALFWSPDGTLIASVGLDGHPIIHVWEAATGNLITRYYGHEGSGYDYDFEGLSWSPDGTHIVSVDIFGGIQVWEARQGNMQLKYHGHDRAGGPTTVAWSPNGTRIASGGEDRTVQVWEAATGKTLLVYDNTVAPATLAWSPDGHRLASMASKTVRVWQAR